MRINSTDTDVFKFTDTEYRYRTNMAYLINKTYAQTQTFGTNSSAPWSNEAINELLPKFTHFQDTLKNFTKKL